MISCRYLILVSIQFYIYFLNDDKISLSEFLIIYNIHKFLNHHCIVIFKHFYFFMILKSILLLNTLGVRKLKSEKKMSVYRYYFDMTVI